MNCFDCAGLDCVTPAVAICLDCGAAVCHRHARLTPRWLTYTAPINRAVRLEPPTRSIRCNACQGAHDALPATRAAV